MRVVPVVAAVVAAAWLAAQALGSPALAVAAAVAAIGGACLLGMLRRPGRRLAVALAPVLVVLTGVLAWLLVRPEDPRGLLVQLALLVVLAPVVPLVYAATFPRRPGAE